MHDHLSFPKDKRVLLLVLVESIWNCQQRLYSIYTLQSVQKTLVLFLFAGLQGLIGNPLVSPEMLVLQDLSRLVPRETLCSRRVVQDTCC